MEDAKLGVVEELHRPARKNFTRRHITIKGYSDLFQADLAEFIPYAKINKGNRYILFVINCYSKFLWARPLKTKNGAVVIKALESILKESDIPPRNLQTDNGTEFYNSHATKLMSKYAINHYSTYTTIKAAIVERVIRTIKNKLYKAFSLRGNYKWLDILQGVVLSYNKTKHNTIQMAPIDVKPNTKLSMIYMDRNLKINPRHRVPKYKIDDLVRISKYKGAFSRGFTPNWSTELFSIAKVQETDPVTYKLKDAESNPISGAFYQLELQKTEYPDTYLIEKILKRRGNQVYVKWLGINEKSWVNKSDLLPKNTNKIYL